MSKLSAKLLLFFILLLALAFRFYNLNWDNGFHMHPDERAITLSVTNLSFPSSFSAFFSPDSPWNPKFFAYGSFPFYLLYFTGSIMGVLNPIFRDYEAINLVGRYLSALADLGTILFLFLLATRLLGAKFALLAAFFYAISVLPIQLSHFYAVDTVLTFFITGCFYFLVAYYETISLRNALFAGFFFGAALATKISAMVLIVPITVALLADYLLLFLRQPHKPEHHAPHVPVFLKRCIFHASLLLSVTVMTFVLFEPYALIDLPTFLVQTKEQSAMTKDAFTFPYTLQYVGKIPYWYEVKNIFLFGLGPLLATLCFLGIVLMSLHAVIKQKQEAWAKEFILVVFFWTYCSIVGSFAIGFMRYLLPVYPLLAIGGAFLVMQILRKFPRFNQQPVTFALGSILLLGLLLWPVSFLSIYQQKNTRVQATTWIEQNIPPGATLALEHWDDALPLFGQENYRLITLPLYDPESTEKWQGIRSQLAEADYIILASNRLYAPLMRLTDCASLPPGRCYPESANYYNQLFSGQLGFRKVVDITSFPTLPFIQMQIDDQGADESFTVYDHPRIQIFKKED